MVFIHGASCARGGGHDSAATAMPRELACCLLGQGLDSVALDTRSLDGLEADKDGDVKMTKSARWHRDLAEMMLAPSRPCYPVERGADVATVFMWRPQKYVRGRDRINVQNVPKFEKKI